MATENPTIADLEDVEVDDDLDILSSDVDDWEEDYDPEWSYTSRDYYGHEDVDA